MTQQGWLKQFSTGGVNTPLLHPISFTENQVLTIGREPACDIVLDALLYGGVSRRHATLELMADGSWKLTDLNSANGTFINGQRLTQPYSLQSGDCFMLGEPGPEFQVESQIISLTPSVPSYSANNAATGSSLTLTQLFPILSTGKDLRKKAFLIPAILTVMLVVGLFSTIGKPQAFNGLLSSYLAGIAYYYIYQLCGKSKPWWVLLLSGLMTVFLLVSPVLSLFILVFRGILPGNLPDNTSSIGFFQLLIGMFFGAGLMEESLKSIPIFFWMFVSGFVKSPKKEGMGVIEPLDAILIGTASAVGFTLLETMGQYVPNIVENMTSQFGEGVGELAGLQLLIPRILGSVAGHMAYSGYFGYFIGLSILKPQRKWQILGVGYLTASVLHALWNTMGSYSALLSAIVGIISYAFLAAAILKARELSPTRSQNFATRIH